jgi:hypothetical protein
MDKEPATTDVNQPQTALASEKEAAEAMPAVAESQPDSEQIVAQIPVARAPVKFLGMQMPKPVENTVYSGEATIARWRKGMVKATPAFIVNNSSNILGGAHVLTEMMMFKASLKDGKLIQNPKNPINWIVEPLVTVFKGVAEGAKTKDLKSKKLFEGNPVKNLYREITDVKDATEREYARQIAEGATHQSVKLPNRWQMRSTFFGLISWGLSTIIPEKKDTPEEVENMAIMRINHPVRYVAERFREAVWFPEWNKHKRQMIGFGVLLSGVCSMLGAWRNRAEVLPKVSGLTYKTWKYSPNPSYFCTGLLQFLGAGSLMLALDEQSGYGGFGGFQLGRIAFLPTSLYKKYKNHEPGANYYSLGMLSFQAENAMQALIGGAEKRKKKLPDGTEVEVIIDHNAIKKEAKEVAREIRRQHRLGHDVKPEEIPVIGAKEKEISSKNMEQEKDQSLAASDEIKPQAPIVEMKPKHHQESSAAHSVASDVAQAPVVTMKPKANAKETKETVESPATNINLETPVVHMKPEHHHHETAAVPAA